MRRRHHSRLPAVLVSSCLWNTLVAANAPPQLELPKAPRELRTNTTSHLIFNTVSGLLQHWPNTIYRNGHTFVPGSIPAGTVLHHGRLSFDPPPSPEYFAFDVEHSSKRDLRVGYFDGTGAATLEGPRDFQDIVFNDKFIPPGEYNPWDHAKSMCVWADRVGLDGIVRMEPSFEAILCNIESDLELVTEQELVYPETRVFPGQPRPFETSSNSTLQETHHQAHPRQRLLPPVSPGPTIPVYPAPPGWTGKQRDHDSVAFEAIRAGMWHNHSPGERRIILDYSGIVSAYDGSYKSLVRSRQGIPRSKHRLADISTSDKARLVDEVNEVLRHQHSAVEINWPALIQGVIDRYAERLEELQYLFKRVDLDPVVVASAARRKVLIMLTPYMVFPQAKGSKIHTEPTHRQPQKQVSPIVPSQKVPDQDWLVRIHNTCAAYATAGILHRSALTKQEERLAKALDDVQSAICSSIVHIWASAFDSEDRPVLAKQMIDQWRTEVDELMGWLDWHTWVKCDPPCGPGLRCVLATWPWEIRTGDEDIGPMCRDYLLDAGF